MGETGKCFQYRDNIGDFGKYLKGYGIDIGCGKDLLKVKNGEVLHWDSPQGDAQYLKILKDDLFDFVYSSHCIEHMLDVEVALKNWCRVLKVGGYLYLTIPDYELYEKKRWPSIFSRHHNFSFSISITKKEIEGRNNHFHMQEDFIPIIEKLNIKPLEMRLETIGYNFLNHNNDQTMSGAMEQICFIGIKEK